MTRKYTRRWEHGDLLVFISYCPDGDGYLANGQDSKEPVMLIAKKRAGREKAAAWGIPLSKAFAYASPDGFPTTYAYERTADIGNHIGLGDSLHVRRQIFAAIGDYMPELLQAEEFDMVREERHGPAKSQGEIVLMNGGQVIGGAEITH